MGRRKVYQEIPADLVQRFAAGEVGVRDVVESTGMSYATVYGRLRRRGYLVPRFKPNGEHLPELTEEVVALYLSGKLRSIPEVAKRLGVSKCRVRYAFRLRGVPIRSADQWLALRRKDREGLALEMATDYLRGDKVRTIANRYGFSKLWTIKLIQRVVRAEQRRPPHRPRQSSPAIFREAPLTNGK